MFKVETTVFWIYGEADSFADELVRDLFNRKMQERVHLLPILKAICPNGQIEGNMFVSDWLRVFLDEGPCGFWITKSPDERSNPMDVQFARRAGATSLESYACMHLGYTTRMAFKELARRGNDRASRDERYLYSFKPRCSLVRAFEALRSKKYPREEDPLRAHGFVLKSTYSYVTLDNKVVYFVCYFQSPEGEIVKLPLTLWSTPSGKLIFDWLHPFAPFPLYRWNLLYGKISPVLICEDEAQVEYLREKHAWLLKQACLTTWSGGRVASIDGTDWGALGDRCVGIIVSPSAGGYKTANKLYRAMKRSGVGPIGFLMPWARLQADQASANAMMSALDEDVTESMLKRHEVADRIEFVKDARERFGLDFEPDLVEAAISGRELLALPVSDAEVVLGPMIMRGDKVMVYAHRGSGKTWLISFIAVACASGGSLFGGRLKAPNPLRVLVIDGEMGARELQKRYSMIFKAMGTPKHLQDNLRFIAARIQGREIQLETPEERERFREDIAWADVIIADSVFCLFPGAMGSQLEGAQGFNEFMRENSLKEKTTIAVDHTGKSKSNSYGTIGKELGLELVLQVEKVKKVENSELFRLSVKKHRNLGSKDTQPIEYQLIVDEGAGVAELVFMSTKSKASASKDEGKACKTSEHLLSEVECDADADNVPSLSGDKPSALLLDELNMKIIAALEADPGLSVRALAAKVGASKGTADNRRKKLEQAGLVWPKGAPVDEGEFEVDDDEA